MADVEPTAKDVENQANDMDVDKEAAADQEPKTDKKATKVGLLDASPITSGKRERKKVEFFKPPVAPKTSDAVTVKQVGVRHCSGSLRIFLHAHRCLCLLQGKGTKLGDIPNGMTTSMLVIVLKARFPPGP